MDVGRAALNLVLGRRLANWEQDEAKIGAFKGIPAMGLDGLASSAYGPEAALAILVSAGSAGVGHIGTITLPVLVLLGILYVSYLQTIRAYPSNGGAYTVTKENLGTSTSLLAAVALMIDYVLNVAVGISAGVAALTSALPALHPYTLTLCLVVLVLLTIINLRGTSEAGLILAVPTYLFVGSFLLLLAIGLYKAVTTGGHPQAIIPPPPLSPAAEAMSLWLLMRAFASGCTAMTGVEAVSNGVSAFQEPVVKEAHRTLTAIVVILALLLAGIASLAYVFHIGAMDETQPGYQSVLSQIAGAVVGRGVFYYIAIGSVLCVLCLSANTSFVGFPRLCRLVAQDDFLPRPFAIVGRRLVFSVGILYLAVAAGLLLIAFQGITDRLIPLFAVGAFLTFTLSQAGMVAHWARERRNETARGGFRLRVRLAINFTGAVATGIALAVIILAKFTEGAWITILIIPCAILLLRSIKHYYAELDGQLRDDGSIDLRSLAPPIVVVATQSWNRLTDRALSFALRLSPDVVAVHLISLAGPDADEEIGMLRRQWRIDVEEPTMAAGLPAPRLELLPAPFRRIEALVKFVRQTESENPDRVTAVLIPSIVKTHWWQYLLHGQRARRLRSALLRCGSPQLVVMSVPWHLEPQSPLEEEDEAAAPSQGRRSVPGARSSEQHLVR